MSGNALERIERLLPGFTQRYEQVPADERPAWLLRELAAALEHLERSDQQVDLLENELAEQHHRIY